MGKPKYINYHQYVLLSNSNIYNEIIKEYPWFDDFFHNHDDLSKEEVEHLPDEQRNFFNNVYFRLIKEALKEWKCNESRLVEDRGPNKQDWVRCQLCGTENRYVYYIINVINQNELNVGSDCIKEFDDIFKNSGVSRIKLLREAIKNRKIIDLEKALPGIFKINENWASVIDEYPIVIPYSLEKPYFELGKKLQSCLENYLENKIRLERVVAEISDILKLKEKLIAQINEYVEEHKNDKYIATKEIERWCRQEGNQKALEYIKEDGEVRWRTAFRITEPNFMRLISADLNNVLDKAGIRIIDIDFDRRGYLLQCDPHKNITLFCSHGDLVAKYGDHIFEENPESIISVREILKFSIIDGERSIDNFIDEIADIMSRINFPIYEYDISFDSITIFERSSQSFILMSLKTFINNFKEIIYTRKSQDIDEIEKYFKNINLKRYNRNQYEDIIELRYHNKQELNKIKSLRRKI